MLASVLPGVRDLRNPLAVGYTLFIALWLLFDDYVPGKAEATGVARSMYDLSDRFGNTATVAAVSFAAYLIGSAVLVSRAPRAITRIRRQLFEVPVELVRIGRSGPASVTAAQLRGRTGERELLAFLGDQVAAEGHDMDEESRAQEFASILNERMARETRNAVARLGSTS